MAQPGQPSSVFLSHASEDSAAAERLADALRSAGITVWFDKNELRGGDTWDRSIKEHIRSCRLFVPLISENTEKRIEGYFRREWKLAAERTHDLSERATFIVPVVIDGTPEQTADVPDVFRAVQWMRLPGGVATAAFPARIKMLLERSLGPHEPPLSRPTPTSPPARTRRRGIGITLALLFAGALVAAVIAGYLRLHSPTRQSPAATADSSPVASAPASSDAEQSIAVLPFVSLSSDREQAYFADGLAEELIDLLSKTPGLHVIARASSFSFKGTNTDIPTIATKLHVANVLEGSIRNSGHQIRVTTQLVRAADGVQLWSQTYDRQIKDVFAIQDDIAKAVVSALQLQLTKVHPTASRRSKNVDAYLRYLSGQQDFERGGNVNIRRALTAYRDAIALDPSYAAAYASLALAEYYLAENSGEAGGRDRAMSAANRAIELAPDLPYAYAVRGDLRGTLTLDWDGARSDFAKAIDGDPNDAEILRRYSILLQNLGELSEATAVARKATALNPFSASAWRTLSEAQMIARDLPGALESIQRSLAIDPGSPFAVTDIGVIPLLVNNPTEALATFQSMSAGSEEVALPAIAMAEYSLGHDVASKRALDEAAARHGDYAAYQIAAAYAWRRDNDQAFNWFDRAFRQRDGGLAGVKTDPLLERIRSDPRFPALLRQLHLS